MTMKLNPARAAQLASLATLCDKARRQEVCALSPHAKMNDPHDFCTPSDSIGEQNTARRVTSTTCQRHVIVGDLKLVTRFHVVGGGQSGAKKLMSFHR